MGQFPHRFTYDVFLSFRGEDVRMGFLGHLYESLVRSGIYAFKDDKRLGTGDVISSSLLKAIENSRVHLVVLSENYASSSWCLSELVHIMDCHRRNSKHVVYPIFYKVAPSDVRKQRGSFGAFFHEHEKRFNLDKVMLWRGALTEVANLCGLDSQLFLDEAMFVKTITKEIRKMSSISYLPLPTYAVGMRQRVQDIYELLCFGSDNVQTIGICGMGGIGKTTLAKAAYNEFSDRFEGTCFLEDFGDELKKGKVDIQRKLLSDILRRDDIGSHNLDHEVRRRFLTKRVLVVIDDVEDKRQLDSVAIDLCYFGPGSRIIITSRNKHLLEQLGIEDIYSAETLNDDESLELVSWHAFRIREPPVAFLQLSKKLVEYCESLPLAIEVLGAFLFKKSITEWESTLERLKRNPDAGIQAKLQVSFDALDEVDKDIFLDISCFFIGMDEDYVSCILNGCEFNPEIGLRVLKDRCLITVRDNKLMMHDLLRDMGRKIVRGTSRKDPEKWSRLFSGITEAMGQIPERFTYNEFLSFRGPDVRNGFLGHLYENLRSWGIYAFKDDKRLETGDVISSSLLNTIENSRVHLVVLSENYASSRWCLDELAHIMECHRRNSNHVVFPIFYKVEPSHVRRQTGSYGASFHEHEKWRDLYEVQKWREALTEVANLKGFHSAMFRDEAKFIKKISTEIQRMLSISYLRLPTYTVGMRQRVKDIYELLCFGSDDVQTIGICGMGGIGKTTLARAAYNEFSDRFEVTCFLENFGESSKDQLQEKLLSHILRKDDIGSNNLDHEVRRRFLTKRVLVVIDDVKDFTQLNSIAIDWRCFGPGSRIIITSRGEHLLKLCGAEKIYSPKALNSDDSLKLVRLHAFRTSEPSEALLQLSKKLAEYCGGLPLAMEVLGTLLFKENISVWESTLKSLKSIPNDNIQAKLQISFDALSEVQKEIFFDISCFFIGMDEDYVSCILNGCEFNPEIGLRVLKDRCLITVRDNKLMMHDLLRDMGRKIVRGTSLKDPEKWSRLWDHVDVIDVLENYEGTNAIEGLSLKAEVTPVDNLEVEAFSELKKLRLLQLSHVHLKGNYKTFPKRLRWLCWFKFPLDSVPTDLYLRKLVVMDMQHSNLKRLWDVQKQPQLLELKYLDLSHSIHLTDTPDFKSFPNLEKLLLVNCESLVVVHNSIGTLDEKLVLINLSGCTKLGELPVELYRLKSLKTLILSGCSKLARLNDALGKMKSLETLKADNTALTQIPSSTGKLKKLKELSLDGCKGLFEDRDCTHSIESPQAAPPIPLSLNGLSCLKTLRLASCNLSDESVPDDLKSLSCLEELDLRGNNFHNLQTDFAGLENLQILKLDDCSELRSMFSLPKS